MNDFLQKRLMLSCTIATLGAPGCSYPYTDLYTDDGLESMESQNFENIDENMQNVEDVNANQDEAEDPATQDVDQDTEQDDDNPDEDYENASPKEQVRSIVDHVLKLNQYAEQKPINKKSIKISQINKKIEKMEENLRELKTVMQYYDVEPSIESQKYSSKNGSNKKSKNTANQSARKSKKLSISGKNNDDAYPSRGYTVKNKSPQNLNKSNNKSCKTRSYFN